MKPIINIEAFRQYYEEAVNCKTVSKPMELTVFPPLIK